MTGKQATKLWTSTGRAIPNASSGRWMEEFTVGWDPNDRQGGR